MNSYNSTKISLVHTQANLRDPFIEISKDGQLRAHPGGEKGKELKGAADAALHPKFLWGSAKRGEKPVCDWYPVQRVEAKRFSERS